MCSGSSRSSDATSWIREIDAAQTLDDLKTSQSTTGNQYTDFEMLDDKEASALKEDLNEHEHQEKNRKLPKKTGDVFEDDKSVT